MNTINTHNTMHRSSDITVGNYNNAYKLKSYGNVCQAW